MPGNVASSTYGPCPARAVCAVDTEEPQAMRVVTHSQNDPPEVLSPDVKSLIVPTAYDLPPSKGNEREHWWKLAYSLTGRVGGTTGWYLHKVTGETTMDLCTTKLYRARALAERYFADRAPRRAAIAAANVER